MADNIRRVDYFYIEVPDQPGSLAPVVAKLKEARVNLLAFTAFPISGGKAQANFVPENTEAFTKAAKTARLSLSERKQAFLVQGPDRVGAVAEFHQKLADAKINVVAANACSAPGGGFGMILWVNPKDIDAAAKALGI